MDIKKTDASTVDLYNINTKNTPHQVYYNNCTKVSESSFYNINTTVKHFQASDYINDTRSAISKYNINLIAFSQHKYQRKLFNTNKHA